MNKTQKVEIVKREDKLSDQSKFMLSVLVIVGIISMLISVFRFYLPDYILSTNLYILKIYGLIALLGMMSIKLYHIYRKTKLKQLKKTNINAYNIDLRDNADFYSDGNNFSSYIMVFLGCILGILIGLIFTIGSGRYELFYETTFSDNKIITQKCYDIDSVEYGAAYKGKICLDINYNKLNDSFSNIFSNEVIKYLSNNDLLIGGDYSEYNEKDRKEADNLKLINFIIKNKDKIKDHTIEVRNDDRGIMKLTFENLVILSERQAF